MDAQDETPEVEATEEAPKRKPGRPKAEPKPEPAKAFVSVLGLRKFHIAADAIRGGTENGMSLKVFPNQTVHDIRADIAASLQAAGFARVV